MLACRDCRALRITGAVLLASVEMPSVTKTTPRSVVAGASSQYLLTTDTTPETKLVPWAMVMASKSR